MDENNEEKPAYKAPSDEPRPIDVDKLLDKRSKETRARFTKSPKHYLDVNMSWPMMILIGLGAFGIGYALQKEVTIGTGYVLLAIFLSFIAGLFFYNVGKIIFALSAGYEISRIEFLGFQFILNNGESKFTFHGSDLLEFHINYAPKNDNVDAKPKMMFLGGLFVYLLGAAIEIGLSFLTGISNNFAFCLRFGAAFGALVVFYEMFPCKLDVPNDMYLLILTSKEEERKAYNEYLIATRRDINGLFTDPIKYDSYDNSRTKPLTLLSLLHSQVYDGAYQEALHTVELIQENDVYLNDTIRCEGLSEELYLLLSHGRTAEGEKLIIALDKKNKSSSDYHPSVSAYRNEVLISGLLDNSLEELNASIDDFKTAVANLGETKRVLKDLGLVNSALSRIRTAHPDWKIDNLSEADLVKKAKEKKKEDSNTPDQDEY